MTLTKKFYLRKFSNDTEHCSFSAVAELLVILCCCFVTVSMCICYLEWTLIVASRTITSDWLWDVYELQQQQKSGCTFSQSQHVTACAWKIAIFGHMFLMRSPCMCMEYIIIHVVLHSVRYIYRLMGTFGG